MAKLTLPQLERHLCGRRHPARQDGCLGVQGVHLRDAVPEALLATCSRPSAASRSSPSSSPRAQPQAEAEQRADDPDCYGESFFVPPQARWEHLRDELHHNVGDGLNKALAALETQQLQPLEGVLQHIDFNRKVGQRTIPDKKLRELITHFNKLPAAQRGLRVPRPARRRLRVPDRRLRRLGRQEGRRVLHARARSCA